MKKLFALFLSGTLVLSALSGCSSSSSSTSVYGGTLRIAINRSINAKALDPIFADGTACDQVVNQYGETLVQLSPDGSEYLPCIATDWTISDDGMTYTFTIRDDVHFQVGEYQDGRLLTAEDVAYSLNRAHEKA